MNENKKQEILVRLKSLPDFLLGGFVLTSDMGLQFDYAAAEGCGTCLGSMGEWPVYEIHDTRLSHQWEYIISKITKRELALKDISKTALEDITLSLARQHESFANILDWDSPNRSLSDFYAPLTNISLKESESFFLMIDGAQFELDDLEVYTTAEEVQNRFKEKYCFFDFWETLDEDSLTYWYDRINNDLEPFKNYLIEK